MNHQDYPALYRAADSASNNAQAKYLLAIRCQIFLFLVGALLSVNPLPTKEYSLLNALVFIAAICISILLATKNYEKTWYNSRALAESIKTASWRFMMKADPFLDATSIIEVKALFGNLLTEILRSNNNLGEVLGGEDSNEEQITALMLSTRNGTLVDRKAFYLKYRIDEQRKWYATKSALNKRRGGQFFFALILLQVFAVISVLLRIVYPEWSLWPTDIFVVAAGGVLTWMQLKRYREITASYSLAAHEIGIIRGMLEDSETDTKFSEFVRDSENAFSREHTQWAAKSDT
ncbi:DUF4231 domain-containing protein [Marinomonas lutimaris]|uniref:DUF4231 domain-containing protein n=1 Tax=Marinomonas lutimaris TaxID=2846746 RepID=UPI001CA48637|nr:DUF4231 domain-containing protein [Marinomonas lutimaris]